MTDRRPDARPPRVRAAEFAASRWTIASGARLHVHLDDDHARVELAVLRDSLGGPPNFPSLVDHHLVWLILDLGAEPDELILTQTVRGFTSVTTTYHHRRSEALQRYADRIAAATRAAATEPPLPDLRDIDAGRGAWEQAAIRSATAAACHWCHYRLGSNLDCPACRGTLTRDNNATWAPDRIAAGLVALDFPDDLAADAADAARRALTAFTALDLFTRDFFEAWAARFAEQSADLFAVADDRLLARDLIEAQMTAPWFALPKHEPARSLALPPALTPDELAAQPDALRRRLHDEGIPEAEAHHRIRTHQCIRRLVGAVAELHGDGARLAGDLLAPAIVIDRAGRPVLRQVITLLGQRTFAAPDLPSADRHAIERRLADIRASLVDAVTTEHTCIHKPDDDALAIERALQRIRADTTPPAPPVAADPIDRRPRHRDTEAEATSPDPAPPAPARDPEPAPSATTTLTLTPEQRLWLLDLLAGFVEDHDASHDDTDPTPPPPNVEWARTLADHLSAEIAALAEQPL